MDEIKNFKKKLALLQKSAEELQLLRNASETLALYKTMLNVNRSD